jgi:hypothetical protein
MAAHSGMTPELKAQLEAQFKAELEEHLSVFTTEERELWMSTPNKTLEVAMGSKGVTSKKAAAQAPVFMKIVAEWTARTKRENPGMTVEELSSTELGPSAEEMEELDRFVPRFTRLADTASA